MMLVGGIRALFLQALYAPAMAAVASHSSFRERPWQRLLRTADYIGITTYGATAEADAAAAHVRAVHARIPRAGDADLLRWIHCCEIDSFLSTTRRAGLALDTAECDRYVAEQVRSAWFVGLAEDDVPHDTAGLAAYLEQMRARLALMPEAYAAVRYLLLPPMPAWVRFLTPAQPGWAAVATLAVALLPAWARSMYRIPIVPGAELAATSAARAMRMSLLAIPTRVRTGPHVRAAVDRVLAGERPAR